MVAAALAVRLAVMPFLLPERLNPAQDHWKFAGETGRIARSIVEGKGFSSPLFADTGPSAWLVPVFPALLAGVFKIFGVYSKSSAIAILSLDCLFGALTCIPVFFIARRHFGQRTAAWAGWIWAFFPYSINFAAGFIWDTTLTTLLLALLFLFALHLEDSARLLDWAGFALLCGIAALTNAVVISVLPLLAAWALYRRYRKGQNWIPMAATGALAFLVVVAPWFIRNYRTFHAFIPFRGGFGLELYTGNNADSWHWDPPGYHPSDSAEEWAEYQQLGEHEYFMKKQRVALAFIGTHRGLYARQTVRRFVYIWTGFWSFGRRYLAEEPMDPYNAVFCTLLTVFALLGLRRAIREGAVAATPYVIVLIFYPLVYYFTHPEDYYRRPIDPMMVVLAAYAFTSQLRSEFPAREAGKAS
jgi:4-amino-4-deoxy-L-arabinose transferase-like glycosyltransferase